jgi:hypothetical protein
MRIKTVVKMFKKGNVCVTGLRGTGKDMLTSNVVVRRKEEYVSNIDYGGKYAHYNELDFNKLDLGGNTYKNLLEGNVKYYKYPYPSGSDIYISDVGVYFPSQYCNELNRDYKHLPMYMALSRQVSHNNVHINVQNLNRAWDKIREQSDIYIRCRRCIVLFGKIVIQQITTYDKYQSCVDRVEPCKIRVPTMAKREVKENAKMYLDKFRNSYGTIKNHLLIYWNKSTYDTYYFEKLFEGGVKSEKVIKNN